MGDIHDHIPSRPSEELIGELFGARIEPLEVLFSVSVAASFMILVSGAFYPCVVTFGWLVLVPAIGIAVAVVASMFGAVMHCLTPFASFAVFLHDFLSCGE